MARTVRIDNKIYEVDEDDLKAIELANFTEKRTDRVSVANAIKEKHKPLCEIEASLSTAEEEDL